MRSTQMKQGTSGAPRSFAGAFHFRGGECGDRHRGGGDIGDRKNPILSQTQTEMSSTFERM